MHHAMHHTVSSVACPAVQYFCPHYLTTGTIFGGGGLLNIKCDSIFSKMFSEIFLTLRINERDMIESVYCFYVNYPLFLSRFNETRISRQIFEKYVDIRFH